MRVLSPALAAHLARGATTLCHCWKLIRRDGLVSGYTDHDRDLVLDGVTFGARTGLEAAEATAELGFAVGGGEVSGALVAAGITEGDIAAGLYDDATVETWLVNWSAVEERLLLDVTSIGEIRRADGAFVAELRSLTHRLDEEKGRLFRATCSADLGDPRCRVDLNDPAFSATATVARTDGQLTWATTQLESFADSWFAGGRIEWLTGANAGLHMEIRAHRAEGGEAVLDLWQRTTRPIAVADAFRVTAGCDKRFSTCRTKFANVVNFRGFPHMPGNDFIIRLPRQGEAGMDGGSLFR